MRRAEGGGFKSWMKRMMFRSIHGMMSCREFEEFLQSYIDGELDESTCSVFERHIRFCRECREYLAAYRRAIEVGVAVMNHPDDEIPTDEIATIYG